MTSYILTAIVFIIILGLLVFVHELGHYSMAKKAGMKVEEFGFGLPPRLYKWKKWNTLWTLNAIPIGGFVRVKGGDSMTVSKKDFSDKENYHSKTWRTRHFCTWDCNKTRKTSNYSLGGEKIGFRPSWSSCISRCML